MSDDPRMSLATTGLGTGLDLGCTGRERPDSMLAHLKKLADEELMGHLKAGQADALAVLFDRYYRVVLNIARMILRDPGEAEDLMQSVFCEIFQSAEQFDPSRGSARTWIVRYAYSRSLNRKHYLNVRSFYHRQELNLTDMPDGPAVRGAAAGLAEPEAKRLIHEALATLSARQQRTLKRAFFEGLSMAEIAERQNETVIKVRHDYYRGLQKLRSLLYGAGAEKSPRNPAEARTSDRARAV